MKKHLFLSLPLAIAALSSSQAMVVYTDDFNYPAGPLVGNGSWVNKSGTPGTLLVNSTGVAVSQDSGSEDAEVTFANDLTTGFVRATFDMVVTSATSMISGTDFEYFAHFTNDGNFNFRGRVDIVAPNGSSGFTVGISSGSSTAEATLPVDFQFGDTVNVVLTFDLDTGLASVAAGGQTVSSTTVETGETLDTFNLRQSNSSSDETVTISNLTIEASAVPEPSSTFLAGLGLGGLMLRRRR